MSRIVQVRLGDCSFAGIQRDDGTIVLRDIFAPTEGFDLELDGVRYHFVRRAVFASELEAAGLQPVWSRIEWGHP